MDIQGILERGAECAGTIRIADQARRLPMRHAGALLSYTDGIDCPEEAA
jgi:hypothetical protein